MDNDLSIDPDLEDVLIHGPGRVKQGLLWLGSEEAKVMGLSLNLLIEQAVVNPETSAEFDLGHSEQCAIGYATERGRSMYYDIQGTKGVSWTAQHGFCVKGAGGSHLYASLTDEWRTQLQALADERGRA